MSTDPTRQAAAPMSRVVAFLIFAVCALAIGSMLVVPADSKVVERVYGAF